MRYKGYSCHACGKIRINKKPLKDANGNLFCLSCYKKHGKPTFFKIEKLLEKILREISKK